MNGALAARIDDWRPDLDAALAGLYGDDASALGDRLVEQAVAAAQRRSPELRELDARRLAAPGWYQSPQRIGYAAYVDRFGGDLRGVSERLPYLRELGVDVLHLLSLLQARDGENDGGYAIRDYRTPDRRWGTTDDLVALIDEMRAAGMSLCVDLVLNHTSDDHEWAQRAIEGSERHRALYRTFADRTDPDRYEATLPEVFPELSPGNFTWNEGMQRWVWTTFRDFQWDLDWSNPEVMVEMFGVAAHLAGLGVEILRLDAIAFTWKRMGTNCQNQPEAHLVAQALRAALAIAAPATVLLAEAIVEPTELVGYLGRHDLVRRECELAYHNQLMVQSWSMLASGRTDLARHALWQLPDVPERGTWFTYVRCHDDIGWAIDDADAAAVGITGPGHRDFLAAYYRGDFWQSFARGTPFGVNDDTGDERTSGMTASLVGIAAALETGDDDALDTSIHRLLLIYGIALGYGGIPMIYMGDELALGDDASFREDPDRRGDSRWTHRPRFDDERAAQRTDPATVAGRVWSGMTTLIAARRTCAPLQDGAATVRPLDVGCDSVFAWRRRHDRFGEMIGMANVGETPARITEPPHPFGVMTDVLAPNDDDVGALRPFQVRWLVAHRALTTCPAPASGRPGGRTDSPGQHINRR